MAEVQEPIQLHTRPTVDMDEDQFFEFCQLNRDLRIERTSDCDILILFPKGASASHAIVRFICFFDAWAEENSSGRAFLSAGFIIPNGAVRSPDVAWVSNSRLKKISDQDWNKFLPLCPDFVLELRSPSDRLKTLQDKMQEYIANGARLGWLLDPVERKVHTYRPKAAHNFSHLISQVIDSKAVGAFPPSAEWHPLPPGRRWIFNPPIIAPNSPKKIRKAASTQPSLPERSTNSSVWQN